MSTRAAVALEPSRAGWAPIPRGTRQLVWIACFEGDVAWSLARRLVDAHIDVRVLEERTLSKEVRTPDLVVLDGDRTSPEDWPYALRARRLGTPVIVCFDAAPAIWFVGAFTVLDEGPSPTCIVETVLHHLRWAARPPLAKPRWTA